MKIKTVISLGSLLLVLILAAGIISCSNPDQRPLDTFFGTFPNPLPKSPVGLIITDPVFRQTEPDPLVREAYLSADLEPLTSTDLWNYFTSATSRIDIVGTRITNPDMVARLAGIANRGVPVNIVCENGYFNDSEAAQYIAQLAQSGNVTIRTDNDGISRQVHSHYAIIDDHIVLASSGDFLDNSFNLSINNTLVFTGSRTYVNGTGPTGVSSIIDAFLFDFDQMFNMDRFGGDKERLINHSFNLGVSVEIYFGPNDNLLEPIVQEVNNVNSSMMFAINQISDATMSAVINGFAQMGFIDWPSNSFLTEEDYPNATLFSWPGYNSVNHKMILIDLPTDVTNTIDPVILNVLDPVVITGSCNWTHNGLRLNDEQLIIVHDVTLGYEFAIEMGVLSREAAGYGVVFGTVRTHKNVPIGNATVGCRSYEIPGTIFGGDADEPPTETTDNRGNYALTVPTGFLREIGVYDLGDAAGSYILPDIIWSEDQPNQGYNLMPGSSYEVNYYVYPTPSATGTGTGGGGGGLGG